MIKHIVMWQLKENALGKSKTENLKTMQKMLLALKTKIPEIKSITIGINDAQAAPENYDLALIMDFENFEALETYQKHPEHQKVVIFIKEIHQSRAAIDFAY